MVVRGAQEGLRVVLLAVLDNDVLARRAEAVLGEKGLPPDLVELGDRGQNCVARGHVASPWHLGGATVSEAPASRMGDRRGSQRPDGQLGLSVV
jgi:hypothetical protein